MQVCYLFILVGFIGFVVADPVVQIKNGKVEGYTRTSPNNVKFNAFQGIPYAKPPVGNLRFQAPVPHDKWSNTLQAKQDGNRCFTVAKDTVDENEDCLFINVYTPVVNGSTTAHLPVMVYLYGGGFRDGASQYNVYGPDYLIEKGVIMVSMNYRVGPFGFLSTGDKIVPGNAGLKDQRLGLKWVKDNIKQFGGDPHKVTLFGQSAGAASVGLHILSKTSAGLFRAAIAESGSGISNWAYLKDASLYGFDLASKINSSVTLKTNQELLQYLQSVPAKEIDVASTKTEINHPLPVVEVEHDDAFLTKNFYELLDSGDFNRVPLIIGANSEEYISLVKDMAALAKRGASYDANVKKLVPKSMNIVDNAKKQEIGEKIRSIYLSSNQKFEDNLGLTIAYNTESHFLNPAIKHGEIQSKYTDVYIYKFSHGGPMGRNVNVSLPGAEKCTHGEEMFYIFKRRLSGYDNSDLSQFPQADVLTHTRMITLWTNFAKYLNPTPEKDEVLQNLIWSKSTPNNFNYLDIDTDLSIKTDMKQGRYKKWMELFEKEALPPRVVV